MVELLGECGVQREGDSVVRTKWTYTYVDRTNVNGLLDAVRNGQADMAATNISITAVRQEVLDFSQPVLTAGLQIAVSANTVEHTLPGLGDFLKLLFSETMWVWLAAALALTIIPAHIIWLLQYRKEATSYFPGIFKAFTWALAAMVQSPLDEPRRWPMRAFSAIWLFVSIAFISYFTAILTANLTVDKISEGVSTPGDLTGKKVCAVDATTSAAGLTKRGVSYTAVANAEECYSGLADGRFDAIVNDAPILQYWVSHSGAGIGILAGPVFQDEV